MQEEPPPVIREEAKTGVTSHVSVIAPANRRLRHYTIMAWNINGVRSVLKTGVLRHLLKTYLPTILCLGELKQRADKLVRLRGLLPLLREFGYDSFHFHTCDKPNTGYSGTAILCRTPPQQFLEGWAHLANTREEKHPDPADDSRTDDEGRVISAIFPRLIVIHTYSPSTGFDRPDREKFRRSHDRKLRKLVAFLKDKYKRPVMLTGDLNVTPTLADVWDGETNPERETWPGCKPFERESFAYTVASTKLIDGYEYFETQGVSSPATNKDRAATANKFTFWRTVRDRAQKKGWRLDIALLDRELLRDDAKRRGLPYVRRVDHYHRVYGSDHIPIGWVVWNAELEAAPEEQETTVVSPTPPPLITELAEARELLRTTEAKDTENETPDPFDDDDFVPGLDDEFLYSLDKELEDEADFNVKDVVNCLRYRTQLVGTDRRTTRRREDLLKMTLRAARLVTATVPMLPASIGGHFIDILMDSGASYSILSTGMVRSLVGDSWRRLLVTGGFQPRFELADGRFKCSVGSVRLPVKFRDTDKHVLHDFFVLDAPGPLAILGVNFFMRTGAIIDFAKQRVIFRRLNKVKAVPFRIQQAAATARGAVCPIFLAHDVTLQPNEQADTMGYLEEKDPLAGFPCTGIVDRCCKGMIEDHMTAQCVTKFNNQTMSRVVGSLLPRHRAQRQPRRSEHQGVRWENSR